MYCINCGNELDDKADVCLNCGVLVKKVPKKVVNIPVKKKKTNTKVGEIITVIVGAISVILSISLFFHDISSVGMYTEVLERVSYTLNYSMLAILFAIATLVLVLVNKKKKNNVLGLGLAIFSLFLIVTEFLVVIIY